MTTNQQKKKDELVTVEKLIVLHPLFINLWIRLADVIYLKLSADCSTRIENENENENENASERRKNAFINHYSVCYLTISELIRHGYQFRSEIVSKQKHKQKLWVSFFSYLFVSFYFINKFFKLFFLLLQLLLQISHP